MNKFHSGLFGLATMVAFAPAVAQPEIVVDGSVPSATVSYADLDIGTAAGRKTLTNRAKRAASRLCTEIGFKPVEFQIAEHRCVADAMVRANADIGRAVANRTTRLASTAAALRIAVR